MPTVPPEQGSSTPAIVIGSGFIGRAAATAIAATGRRTIMLTQRTGRGPIGVETVMIDLLDRYQLRALIGPGCDVVFATGNSIPADDEADPLASARSLQPLVAVLDAIRAAARDSSFLFLSSGGAVYGEPEQLPIGEDHPLRPRSAYGAAKAAGETYVSYFARRYGVAATSLRCGNAYGPGQLPGRGQGLIGELLSAADEGRTVEIWGDGSVQRDFVHVGDIAHAIAALCGRRDLPPALNVGSGQATSVREVIDLVADVVGHPLRVNAVDERPFDVHHVALDITRLQRIIEFDPISLRDGITRTRETMVSETVA